MPQITLASLANTSVSPFNTAAELSRPRPVPEPAAAVAAVRALTINTDGDVVPLPSSPIAERFCGALALSALLGFGAATLFAHGASADSPLAMAFGLSGVFGALAIQIVERRRAKILLTEAALERGLEPTAARHDARERLRLWLS